MFHRNRDTNAVLRETLALLRVVLASLMEQNKLLSEKLMVKQAIETPTTAHQALEILGASVTNDVKPQAPPPEPEIPDEIEDRLGALNSSLLGWVPNQAPPVKEE